MADSEMPLIRRAEAFRTDCNFKIRKKAQVGENSIAKVDSKKKTKAWIHAAAACVATNRCAVRI